MAAGEWYREAGTRIAASLRRVVVGERSGTSLGVAFSKSNNKLTMQEVHAAGKVLAILQLDLARFLME